MKVTREELIAQGCTERRNQKGTIYFEDSSSEVIAKVCRTCTEVTMLDGFGKYKRSPDGYATECRNCQCEYKRRYYEDNTEKLRVRTRKYHDDNRERILEYMRKYSKDNTEKMRMDNYNWRMANPETPEKSRARQRKYREDNSEKVALTHRRRRARKALLPDTFTIEQQTRVLTYFNGVCALTDSTEYHMDHAIPLNCGHGGTTYENMIPLRDDLNMSKHANHPFEWFEANRERFSLEQAKFDALIAYLAEVNGMNVKEYRAYVDWCFDNPRSLDDLTEEDAV